MKKSVSSYNDAGDLAKLMVNAKRLGDETVYNDAFKRKCELEGADVSDPLHGRFLEVLAAYEGLLLEKHGRRQPAGRTRQKMAKSGIETCLIDWALDSKESDAFKLLSDRGMLNLTGEFVITQFPDSFESHVVAAANARLDKYR